MIILGCNLNASYQLQQKQQRSNDSNNNAANGSNNDPKADAIIAKKFLSKKTMMGTYVRHFCHRSVVAKSFD